MQFEITQKAGKLPIFTEIRELIKSQIAPMLLKPEVLNEQFYPGNGENLTTGQDSVRVQLTNDDGTPAGTLMVSFSANYWKAKPKGESATKGGREQDSRITLLPEELAGLDAAIATCKEANDFDTAVKLATIKSVASQNGGKVSRADYMTVNAVVPQR